MGIFCDRILHHGRPASAEGRSANEMAVYERLDALGIAYDRLDHAPAMTIADCAEIDGLLGGSIAKNLFLCNAQKTSFYLASLPGEKHFQTRLLSAQLGCSRLSFAPPERMEEMIGCKPGSASLLGILFDPDNRVCFCMDRELLRHPIFACHPCANTSSLRLRTSDITDVLLPAVGHPLHWVEL